jgi:hypothetical protein
MPESNELLMTMDNVVEEILQAYDVDRPPIPVELMLQRPRADTWAEIDLTEMSVSFLSLADRYAPRMSAVRLLARNIIRSEWGKERGLGSFATESNLINMFARAIIMPRRLLEPMEKEALNPTTISLRFEVPEEDAQERLKDLNVH